MYTRASLPASGGGEGKCADLFSERISCSVQPRLSRLDCESRALSPCRLPEGWLNPLVIPSLLLCVPADEGDRYVGSRPSLRWSQILGCGLTAVDWLDGSA
jgi:hypothetical protein